MDNVRLETPVRLNKWQSMLGKNESHYAVFRTEKK